MSAPVCTTSITDKLGVEASFRFRREERQTSVLVVANAKSAKHTTGTLAEEVLVTKCEVRKDTLAIGTVGDLLPDENDVEKDLGDSRR